MIEEEIKLYEEPPSYTVITYPSTIKETQAQHEAWLTRCNEAKQKAQAIFKINDQITSKNNKLSVLTITEFIDDVEDMQKFAQNPCVLYAKNPVFTGPPIQYSLEELDMSTHIPFVPTLLAQE